MTSNDPSATPDAAGAPSAPSRSHAKVGRLLRRALGWALGVPLAALLAALLLLALGLALAYPNLPDIGGLTDYRPRLPLRVVSADGVLLGEFGEERRIYTPIAQIPPVMQQAVLAIEDARFYQHRGVDYWGVLRAGLAQFRKAKSQGASTITMQVARNFYLSTEKTFTRKIYEILLALKIERQLSKEQILEVYMNQIFLGQRAYGFAAASEVYFGKPLREVSVAEAAMLAGLPQAPSAYNPVRNLPRATRRQQYIVDRMQQLGFITDEQAAQARGEVLRIRPPGPTPVHAEYVAETVRQLIQAQYGEQTTTRGLTVQVTLDAAAQTAAYRALRDGLMDYERRQPYRGPEAFIELPPANSPDLDVRIAEALAEHPDNDDILAAVVLNAAPRAVEVALQSGLTLSLGPEALRAAASALADNADEKKRIRRGAVVRVLRNAKGQWQLTQLPEVQGALVALDPVTGGIRALVGGFDYQGNQFNHVTQAWRQPGSSFKPFIYSAALEKGYTPLTLVNDGPLFFDAGTTGSQAWEPKNYDGKFDGPMPLKTALAKSKNMVSIRLLQRTGVQRVQDWVTRFGFDAERHPPYLTMALGAGAVTPLQLASGYSVFANGGYRISPRLITRVTGARGRLLAQAPAPALDESVRAIDARNAYVMTRMMGEVTRSGTAARVWQSFHRSDLYGKTGTTNDSLDAWFAGYHPRMVAVVWIGYDTPRKLGDRETGGGLALPVWISFMRHALPQLPVSRSEPPAGLVQVGNDWVYAEFASGGGAEDDADGVEIPEDAASDAADALPAPPSDDERKGILELFR